MYTTDSELLFIKRLGEWSKSNGGKPRDREKCLKGYIESVPLRKNWGDIDPDIVENYAKTLYDLVRR
jgi:hypothetical protein